MRRALCTMVMAALLATIIPRPALAISASEALFGNAEVGMVDPAEPANAVGQADATGQYPTLQLGDRDGEDSTAYIVFLQNRLIELGYLRDAADGVYGDNTQTAVLAFQRNNNLPDTGIADAATQKTLYSDISTLVPAQEDSTMFGGEVTRVQTMLGVWGFYTGKVDGISGNGTKKALTTFKSYMSALNPTFGVTPTPVPTATPNPEGRFDDMPTVVDMPLVDDTGDPLTDGSITPAVMEYVDGEKPFTIYRATVAKGDDGSEALRVQTRLKQLNYLYAADGAFGNLSELAVQYFQRKNNLPVTGIADEATQRILFSPAALESEEYVFPYKLVVDISEQRIYVGEWTGTKYKGPIHTFICATGKKDTPTPLGTYQANGKTGNKWYYFKNFGCYACWAYNIVGGVLFHSNTVSNTKQKPSNGGLGRPASHGCIRMKVDDAKWIYDNCPSGTTVVIQQ